MTMHIRWLAPLGFTLMAAAALSSAEPLRELRIVDFEGPVGQANLGGEFPGAIGSFEVVSEAAHDGSAGGRLSFDLNRGAYVAWVTELPVPLVAGARELTVWVRSDAPGRLVHCKTRDATGQEHIRYAPALASTAWQHLTFDLTRHTGHWSGANDGTIHWPITTLQIGVEARGSAKVGRVDLDRIAVTTTASPAAQPGLAIRLETGRFGNLFGAGEPIGFTVVASSLEDRPGATLVGTRTVRDWQGHEVASGPAGPFESGRVGAQSAALPVDVPGVGAFCLVLDLHDSQTPAETFTATTWFGVLSSPNPPPCGWVGAGLHGGHGWGRGDLRFLDILSAAGIGVVREEFGWSGIEKAKGEYVVSPRVEQFVDALHERGIRLNLLLTYGNPLYDNPLDPAAYARWAGWMATHFAGRVRDFEIWNEPANFMFQKQYGGERFGNAPWIGKFVELSLQAGAAIRVARSDANIVLCAEDCWPTLRQMLEEGIGPAGNVISIHPYCHGQPRPEREWFLNDGGAELRRVSQAHTGPERVVLTEAGWTTYEGEMEYLKIAGGYPRSSYVHQAQYLVRMFLSARACGADYAIQYDFMNDGPRRSYTEHNFGLVHEDASPKPSLLAVAALTRLLGQGSFVGDASPDPARLRVYVFDVAGRPVLAAYAVEGTTELDLPVGVPRVEVADLMGNRQVRACSDETLHLDVTEAPVYVLGGSPAVAGRFWRFTAGQSAVEARAGDTVHIPLAFTSHLAGKARPRVWVQAPPGVAAALAWDRSWWRRSIPVGGQRTADLAVAVPPEATTPFDVTIQARLAGRTQERTITVRPQPPVSARFGTLMPSADGPVGMLLLTNHSTRPQQLSAAIAVAVAGPPARSESSFALAPGQSRAVSFRAPAGGAEAVVASAAIRAVDGWQLGLDGVLLPGSVGRLPSIPALDGALAAAADLARLPLADRRQWATAAGQTPWRGAADLAALVRLGWCAEGLYIRVEVTDDVFCQPFADDSIWQGDSVQFAVAPGTSGPAHAEIGLARTSGGDRSVVYSSLPGSVGGVPVRVACHPASAGGGLTYEALVPWTSLPGITPAPGTRFRFSLLVNDNDGQGRRGWLHAFDGIGWSKDPAQYGEMVLQP